jgi:hypothetical protein
MRGEGDERGQNKLWDRGAMGFSTEGWREKEGESRVEGTMMVK